MNQRDKQIKSAGSESVGLPWGWGNPSTVSTPLLLLSILWYVQGKRIVLPLAATRSRSRGVCNPMSSTPTRDYRHRLLSTYPHLHSTRLRLPYPSFFLISGTSSPCSYSLLHKWRFGDDVPDGQRLLSGGSNLSTPDNNAMNTNPSSML